MKKLHNWNLSYKKAIRLQTKLAGRVKHTSLRKPPKLIAGLDCAFTKDNKKIIAAVTVLTYPDLELIETKHVIRKLSFPYIPGLLSFREAPALLAAIKKLKSSPDLFLVDGQGIAHPRKLGLASHIGLFLKKPTIGCAKSRLIGNYKNPSPKKGSHTPLTYKNQIIGIVLRTRTNVKPVFISVGNNITLKDAIKWTLKTTPTYRLPEPIRSAHHTVTKLKSTT